MLRRTKRQRGGAVNTKRVQELANQREDDKDESTEKLDKSEVDEVTGGKGDPNSPIVTPEI